MPNADGYTCFARLEEAPSELAAKQWEHSSESEALYIVRELGIERGQMSGMDRLCQATSDVFRRKMAALLKDRKLPLYGPDLLPATSGPYLYVHPDEFAALVLPTGLEDARGLELAACLIAEPLAPAAQPAQAPDAALAEASPLEDWKELARDEARKIIKQDASRDCYPPQKNIADRIAANFRSRKPPIVGAEGKPLTGATIKRHALKGIDSTVKKAQSTKVGRGK